MITFSANATDDIAVASVNFFVNGQLAFTTSSQPYQFMYMVPCSATTLTFGATAVDYGNNVGTAQNVVVPVVPDPLTTVTGRVVDSQGNPIASASVSAFGISGASASEARVT
jgi:large repetitive protein